jgi:hypothetical protein
MEHVMLRSFLAIAAAADLSVVLAAPALAIDSYTTRIEPRAVYGATVTIEEGVRVYRPIPTEQHVIINPGGTTPLSLGYYTYVGPGIDPRFTRNSVSGEAGGGSSSDESAAGGWYWRPHRAR